MRDNFIPVNTPVFEGNEKKYLEECIRTGWVSSEGPFVERFESELSSTVARDYGVAVANGSAALDVAVAALDISSGDEVIMPSFTIISCASAVVRAGATPVLVDSDPKTWNMNVQEVESLVTQRTKAIMVVHIYGLPVDMAPILKIAEKYGLTIIEDASQMLGQTYDGKPCGSFGDISTFSFYPNKLITTGEGGMCVTDNKVLAEKCRSLRNLCFQHERRFVHESLGWNYRMSNIHAALGCAQLERSDKQIIKKRKIGKLYSKLLNSIPTLQIPVDEDEHAENIYWVYGLVLNEGYEKTAEEIMIRLADLKIGTRPFFWPLHEQPVFKKMGLFNKQSLPVSEGLARRGFYVPSGLGLKDKEIAYVASSIKQVVI